MSFLFFAAPYGLIGLLTMPLIILLYVLKQKREKVTVPSLMLWSRVLNDMQAETPWRKLKKNLLLFIQITAALLIVLALAGLSVNLISEVRSSVIIVIDRSLSMGSTDVKPTRLSAAKKDAIDYVNSLPAKCKVTVVSMGKDTQIVVYDSVSKDEIRKGIESVSQTCEYADAEKAAELVLSLKKQDPDAQIVLFSDTPFKFGNEQVQYAEYKKQNGNMAVAGFSHAKTGDGVTAMTIVRNQGDEDAEIAVSLYGDGAFLDSQWVTVPAGRTKTVWWNEIPASVRILTAGIDTEDILPDDNYAYEVIPSEETAKVLLVTDGNIFLEKVLSLIDGVELARTSPENLIYEGYDLYVFDGLMPEILPKDGNVVVFSPAQNSYFHVGEWMDTPETGRASHPIFRYLDNLSFSVLRTRIMERPEWAETIMEYNQNPLIMEGFIGNTKILVFGFDLLETDLPLRAEFPVLISNIVDEYAPQRGTSINNVYAGDAVEFTLNHDTVKAYVHTPDGRSVAVAPPVPAGPFIDTGKPGIYSLEQIKDDGSVITLFDVNINDEWLMEKASYGTADNGTEYKSGVPLKKQAFSLTPTLLLLAVMILLFEWWYYANRNYV